LDEEKKEKSDRSALVMIAMRNQDTSIADALTQMNYEIVVDLPTFKDELASVSGSS
jgi:hypothetical protein